MAQTDTNLVALGEKLALIDEEIIELLAERMGIARDIELIKRDSPISIIRPDIERMRMSKYIALADELGISVPFVASIFYQIHGESIKVQLAQLQEDFRDKQVLGGNEGD